MNNSFNLVFIKVDDNQDPNTVRLKLAESLKTEESRVQAWIDAQGPVTLLRDVDQVTAEKVRNVVLRCGAICHIEEMVITDKSGLDPVQRKFGASDRFICPQCQAEQEIPAGSSVEVCETCGLVVQKWEQKQRADREKQQLRRTQLRESSAEDRKVKREEISRLESEADAIRNVLGIKGPGQFETILLQYPRRLLITACLFVAVLTMSASIFYYHYQDIRTRQSQMTQDDTARVLEIAPVLAASVRLEQVGNARILIQMANVSSAIRQTGSGDVRELESAARLMLKDMGPGQFLKLSGVNSSPGIDAPGTMAGLDGVDFFTAGQLPAIAGGKTGTDRLLDLFALTDASGKTADGPELEAESAIDRLDSSELVSLLKAIAADREWDEYLKKRALQLVYNGRTDLAEEVARQISTPFLRVGVLSAILLKQSQMNNERGARFYAAKIELELNHIEDSEQRIIREIEFGRLMSSLGDGGQPGKAYARVEEIISGNGDSFEQAVLGAQLASALDSTGNTTRADVTFARAIDAAVHIESGTLRMRAFTRIAQRYYDARNTTLATEILDEIIHTVANSFAPSERALVFADLALAQAYIGDMRGAYLSISNTGSGKAQTQVLNLTAEFLIANGYSYRAMEVIDTIDHPLTRSQLLARLASELIANNQIVHAESVLEKLGKEVSGLAESDQKTLLISKMARLYTRLDLPEIAQGYFKQAHATRFKGRRADLTSATIAIDQLHSMMFKEASETLGAVTNPIIREPIETLISAVRLLQSRLKGA